ncbi:uncharacterized protein [Drosophila takahashii]|uniref:uncharacterized protein n=1 Tax=Drosophila takahashii TaxID=29030 RepID=UPI001CF80129|nr:uncharacterized protein LOC108056191 [Drosophila takahashii]XP_016995385.2 uncharacterized protein LOC108056191 [Drosophila takahashii]XP_016995386.2 uncharacterized protein LOC108056191 [Drosophila takahashii]
MAFPSRNVDDILEAVQKDPFHLRNLPNIYKLELELQKRERGHTENVSHSRILLREGPDILAKYKNDEATLELFNILAPAHFYSLPLRCVEPVERNIANVNTYLVIPGKSIFEPESPS